MFWESLRWVFRGQIFIFLKRFWYERVWDVPWGKGGGSGWCFEGKYVLFRRPWVVSIARWNRERGEVRTGAAILWFSFLDSVVKVSFCGSSVEDVGEEFLCRIVLAS